MQHLGHLARIYDGEPRALLLKRLAMEFPELNDPELLSTELDKIHRTTLYLQRLRCLNEQWSREKVHLLHHLGQVISVDIILLLFSTLFNFMFIIILYL